MTYHPGTGDWRRNARELKPRRIHRMVMVTTCRVCKGPNPHKSAWNSLPDDVCSSTCAERDRQNKILAARAAAESPPKNHPRYQPTEDTGEPD